MPEPEFDKSKNATKAVSGSQRALWRDSVFIKACKCQPVSYTPVWLMRQAGRFMPEYRHIRAKVGFLELCKSPDLAAEVTVMAQEKLGVDAAIIFADILLPLEAMGVGLEYAKGDGPVIFNPVHLPADVARLAHVEIEDSLGFVLKAITIARSQLNARIPLIGFAGAPFTLASYLIEGGSARHFDKTKSLMYTNPECWHALMERLVDVTTRYLNAQIAAGVQAIQLFDSWVGCLAQEDYKEFVLPYTKQVITTLNQGVPVIHFGTPTAHLLELMRQAGGDVIGLDWRCNLDEAWRRVGYDVAVQGNLDPVVLLAEPAVIKKQAARVLQQAQGRPGHIFNLGHGVLPNTPFDHVRFLVESVHELGGQSSDA
ncbi:MAG: uroporphyrinogen decarboxylase [Candidatus Melainabacteria bacterium]|nr:uroporphyrinogen decarboxylase [Candidatus Melainabacteria bacterium]